MSFVLLLSQVEAKHKDITIKLHTYGGSVFDGNLMANALRDSKANIRFEIVGIAASMGFVISVYLKNVFMVRNGFMMSHAPSGYTEGDATAHENAAKLLRSIEKTFVDKLMQKTGKNEADTKTWLIGDNWIDAVEAEKLGLIKGIIENETEIEIFDPEQLGITESYNRFSALLIPKNTNHKSDHTMKKPIIEVLALLGVTEQSSDTAVIEAVKQHYDAKIAIVQTKLDAEIELRTTAEKKLADDGKAAIDALISEATTTGKITAIQVATYEGIAKASGVEALKTVLAAIPARKTIAGQMVNPGSTNPNALDRDRWDFDKWQKEDPKGLEKFSKESPEAFQELVTKKYSK